MKEWKIWNNQFIGVCIIRWGHITDKVLAAEFDIQKTMPRDIFL